MKALVACLAAWVVVSAFADEAPTLQDAQGLLQQQDFSAAAGVLERIVDGDPENARAWMMLGQARHGGGEYESALAAHMRAASFEETAPQALYNAARSQARLGRTGEAIDLLRKAKATGKVNLTGIPLDPDFAGIKDIRRVKKLMPSRKELARPFVEPSRILREWRGEGQGDQFGWIAREVGDVDGDGTRDVATSAPTLAAGGDQAGRVYVYSGASGKRLWTATGAAGGQLGFGVEAAGDVDGDGTPDVVAGEPGNDRVHVYAGSTGRVLLSLAGAQEGEFFGGDVTDVGDVDDDGHDDVLIGAPQNDLRGQDAGRAALHSGKDGKLLAEWFGERAGDRFGSACAGTVHDGAPLLVIGAPGAGAGEARGGRVYVYRGLSEAPFFVIESDDTGAALGGMFVSVVGDVDADGTPDVYASDWSNGALGRSTGRVYVHSGRDGTRLGTLTGEAAGDGFGIGPADAGDADGDGHDDLIVGAWQHRSAAPSGGKVYLYSGRDFALIRSWTGQIPGETLGFDATGIGDVDGDGAIDFLVTSAWSAARGSRSGRVFVLAGPKPGR